MTNRFRSQVRLTTVLGAALLSLPGLLASQPERVPESRVINGVPQGIFVGRSLLTGRAVCLLFLSEGRITRAIPAGGLESFDWARHKAEHQTDVGVWRMEGRELRVVWGDGGVHVGPLAARAEGIEFYGKRYSTPQRVELSSLVGRWEATRGTAIAGGGGVHVAATLILDENGRYRWASVIGGVVSGRATAAERAGAGTVSLTGATLVLRSDGGTTTAHTFLPAAGIPVQAFTLDGDLFVREK
jgi:hypothetical protein